jgi:hypothetical protein
MTVHATKITRVDSFNIIPPLAFVFIAPLGVLVPLVLIAPSGLVLWGLIPALTRIVVVIHVPSFPLGIVRGMSGIGCVQLFKILVLLSSRGLNKIYPRMRMWGSHGLGRTRKGKLGILWGYRSIRYIGRHSAFTSIIS